VFEQDQLLNSTFPDPDQNAMFTFVVDTRRTERVIHFHISILLSKNIISHNLTGKDSLSSRGKESGLVMSSGDDQRPWHLVIHFKCQVIWLEIIN
jgi:hypothetical protein